MPLPQNAATAEWPPKDVAEANRAYTRWAAWWGGDVDTLSRVYAGNVGFDSDGVVPGGERRGLLGLLPRSFHGAPAARGALRSTKLHIPLAADIASTSADLLFGEPPALVVPDDSDSDKPGTRTKASPTQQRLDELMVESLQAVLHESAELAAAFGGVYLRVGWDAEIADMPLFDAIPPDAAVPEFRSGRLVAVTFHRVLRDHNDSGDVWRHLERHEPGKIFHGLYKSGDDKHLGQLRPLTEHPETEAFAKLLGGRPYLETGAKGLAAEYVPNMRPNRRLRGSQLGRSDLDGIEALMDALDEAWTSWMRDLRLGKGRILVPEVYLEGQGRGQGAVFDLEQEVFQQVNALPGGTQSGLAMTIAQFNIRVKEHSDTCSALMEQAVRGAGYSAQTFGMSGEAAVTATEIAARERRSYGTRGKKLGYYRGPLGRLCKTALEIDAKQFGTKGLVPVVPDIEWPDGVAVDPQGQAQTLQLLETAKAVSTRTKVEMLHPDWDDKRIAEEVKAIDAAGMPPEPPAFPGSTVGKPADDPQQPGPQQGAAVPGKPASVPAAAGGPPRPPGPPGAPRTVPAGAPPAAQRPPVRVPAGRR